MHTPKFAQLFKKKRVFITGHTGFKGSWLTLWLHQMGAEVAGYSDAVPTEPSHFEAASVRALCKDYVGDVRDYTALHKAFTEFKPEIVFHIAAEAIVRTCFDDPRRAFEVNLMGTVNCLQAIRHTPSVRAAVIVTSDKCYENVEWEYGYRETDRLGGKDPYSASKACAELAFYAFYPSYFISNPDVSIATGRAGNVIGGGDWARDRIVPDCMRAWSAGKPVSIRKPNATRPWQHVLEPLRGYLTLAERLYAHDPIVRGVPFNFGPSVSTERSVLNLLEEMKKYGKWKSSAFTIETPANLPGVTAKEATLLRLSTARAESKLDWQTALDFKATAAMTAEWYSAYYQAKGDVRSLTLDQIKQYERLLQSSQESPIKKAA